MADIVERLREVWPNNALIKDAAQEIERLQEDVEKWKALSDEIRTDWIPANAAISLDNKRLREAIDYELNAPDGVYSEVQAELQLRQALQTPPNYSALREYVADEMVKMAGDNPHREIFAGSITEYAECYRKGEV